jgi:hypothetical protein
MRVRAVRIKFQGLFELILAFVPIPVIPEDGETQNCMLFRESFVRFRLPFKPPLSLLKKLPLPAYRKRSANERNAVASPRKRPRMRGAFNCLLETRNALLSFRCGLDLRPQTRMSERDAGNFGELLLCGRFQRVLTAVEQNIGNVDNQAASGLPARFQDEI